jgi:hypothetical protein
MPAPAAPGPRGRGRPAIGPQIYVALPAETLAQVDQLAADTEMTRSEVIRRLLTEALAPPLTAR